MNYRIVQSPQTFALALFGFGLCFGLGSGICYGQQDDAFDKLETAAYGNARYSGYIADNKVTEASGMAFSRIDSGRLWLHNDSGNKARLYASNTEGRPLGSLKIDGVDNRDWEDLASVVLDGQAFLVIGDIGDNGGLREEVALHFVAEPKTIEKKMSATPAWSMNIRYPDGPHDCEALAIDADAGYAYLLSKRSKPARLYRVPIRRGVRSATAELVATTPHIPQPSAEMIAAHPRSGRYRSQPTAMDIDPANRQAAVLTYHYAYVFDRLGEEDWPAAFLRAPKIVRLPLLPQGEAIAYSRDGSALYVTSEKWPSPILYFVRD